MYRTRFLVLASVLAFCMFPLLGAASPNAAASSTAAIVGHWSGTATLRGDTKAFGLDIRSDDQGALNAFVYLPETHFTGESDGALSASDAGYISENLALTLNGDALRGHYATNIELDLHRSEMLPVAAAVPDLPRGPDPAWTWRGAAALWASPTVARGCVYFGAADGGFQALRVRDGKVLWSASLGAGVFGAALVRDNTVYVVNDKDELFALSAGSGRQRWKVALTATPKRRSLPSAADDSGWDYRGAAPIETAGVLYVGASDGSFLAIDVRTGRSRWHFQASGPIRSTAVISGNQVFVASFDHHVYALDRRLGHLTWSADAGAAVTTDPVVASGLVVVGTRGYRILALDSTTGTAVWSRFQWFSWVESTPRVVGDALVVGSSDNRKLRVLNVNDGSTRWSTELNGYAFGQPAVAPDLVFEATAAGPPVPGKVSPEAALFAVDRVTGELRWRWPAGRSLDNYLAGFTGSARATRDRLLIGGLDGVMYAFPLEIGRRRVGNFSPHLRPSRVAHAGLMARTILRCCNG